ncbi:MAG: FemAB family XrtA/PEP-CTERM system-associated protein [Planctomycetota bacterium]
MRVRAYAAADREACDRFVLQHPHGSPFHLSAWLEMVRSFHGHSPRHLVAEDDGRIRGVLPLFLVSSPLLGKALISVPYGVYGGILAEDADTAGLLAQAARDEVDRLDAGYLELRQILPSAEGLPQSELYVTFLRDLPADEEECLAMIPRKSRATARHARDRYGMEFLEGPHLIRDFYELFVRNKRSLGSPVFSLSWFERILESYGDQALVHGVRSEGRVVAAVLSFVFGDTLMPYYSGSEPALERLGSMNFLYWNLMRTGVRLGLKRYDFGRSRGGTGAARFKQNMGFEPTPLAYQFYLRGGRQIPTVNPSNPKYELILKAWRRMPLWMVKLLGPRLMRYLP